MLRPRELQLSSWRLRRSWVDFHMLSTTPSYLQYAMSLKSKMKSSLISKQSFSTQSAISGHCDGVFRAAVRPALIAAGLGSWVTGLLRVLDETRRQGHVELDRCKAFGT